MKMFNLLCITNKFAMLILAVVRNVKLENIVIIICITRICHLPFLDSYTLTFQKITFYALVVHTDVEQSGLPILQFINLYSTDFYYQLNFTDFQQCNWLNKLHWLYEL